MFSFIPQLLIILSLAGIILIVVRRTPELRFPMPVHLKNAENFAARWLKAAFQKIWHFTLEVKELTRKTEGLLPKHLPKLHLPSRADLHLPSFGLRKGSGAGALIESGELALKSGDIMAAEQHFIGAIKIDSSSEQAFAGLGRLYLAQNKAKEAVETYKFLVKHHPDEAAYSAGLGQAFYNQGAYDSAVAEFERAIELEPGNSRHLLNLAMTLEAMNHLEEAILNYRRAIELNGHDSLIILKLCDALIKKGEKDEAEQLLQNLLLEEPTNNQAREKLMQIKY
ncbi:hypothetical protein A2671_02095 [Candidatus Kaiserbacteria bacterium RIFCSPHIGHO2_01_FULL_49_13]|uniref:Uncharacterized protein n=1 Tax=Candidatus Kaiserbacteria bacterium RIFCSPHIGHO2_01_FULL_49_13 TaxID=1798477 RepID=A0A1F6CEX1_9BACT|nr:MAG: hypothetical protein A2671_02095 [Candidatus Kaiserbacteria bacterium RIFCSPHIGHO2_01_FULL_49_13]